MLYFFSERERERERAKEDTMAGRFSGLNDEQWEIGSLFFPSPPEKRGQGQSPASRRKVLNSIFYILITGGAFNLPPMV